jgi:signal transduction histidine kinase
MDASSRPRQRRTIVERWRIALLALGAVAFGVLALAHAPSRETHDGILATLRVIDLQHASLQRDVLQARAGLLRNYDPLVGSVAGLHASAAKLRALFDRSNRDGISGFDDELSTLLAAIGSDDELVERFKTSNSLLQNSLEIFSQLIGHSYPDPHLEGQRPTERSGHLGNLMMRFAANPSDDLERQIRAELHSIQSDDAGRSGYVRVLVSHANLVLEMLPLVDQTTLAIQGSRSLHEAEVLRERYLDAYDVMSVGSARNGVILGSISLALFGFVAMFVHRLRVQTQKLTQQLEFESTLDEVKRHFGEQYITMETAVEGALDLLGDFFEVPKGTFVIFKPENVEIEHAFGAENGEILECLVAEATGRLMADKPGSSGLSPPWKSSDLAIHVRRAKVDAVATIQLDAQSAALLRINLHPLRRSSETPRLLEQAAECLVSCVRSVRDREEREALLARLEHSQRLEAIGTLAGGIAHEFNNVLLAMMGYSEMALDASLRGSQAARYIEEIIHSGQRAKLIIDQILAFSRKGERISKPFNMCEAVLDVLPLLRVSLPDQVSLEADIPDRPLAVTGHPIEVQQVLINLCRNAAQACRDTGKITISLSVLEVRTRTTLSHGSVPPGSYVVLRVSDTGSGIDARALPHIFEPFFTTRSGAGGTGLGLAAVHGTVAEMAGHIHVQSRLDVGTRFELYFPVTHRNPVAIGEFLADRPVPTGAGQTIVIAEGDDEARLMCEEKTAALGYEAIGVSSLDCLRSWLSKPNNTADLIIFDTALWSDEPNLSKIVRYFSPIPTLLVGDPASSTSVDRRSLGEVRLLRKPVTTARLARAISTTLSEARWVS